jgi:hypothetical protein
MDTSTCTKHEPIMPNKQMVGNVYSTYEIAHKMSEEKMNELEQDIFICLTKYPSGQEFTLKTRNEIMSCTDYVYQRSLPFRHHFATKANAEREASIFASKKGRPVYVRRKTDIQNGYIVTKYFYLTYKESCST